MIQPLTRDELIMDLIATRRDLIATRKAMNRLRHDLQVARDFCWAARLIDQSVDPADVLDIIGWPASAEGHPRSRRP